MSLKVMQPTKFLQTQSSYSILISDETVENFFVVRGTRCDALQHVERTTAECLVEARHRRGHVLPGPEVRCEKVALGTLDEAKSNPRYIANYISSLPGVWTDITIPCNDHGCFNICGDLGKIHEPDVSGQIHWALSLNSHMGRRYLTAMLRDICKEWLCICRGRPPLEAGRRMKALLRICLGGESSSFERQLHMLYFPNGDPWKRRRIEVWIPIGVEVDRSLLEEAVFRSLRFVLFSKQVRMIRRNRWYGLYPGLSAIVLQDRCERTLAACFM
jgi:hypothetical protein